MGTTASAGPAADLDRLSQLAGLTAVMGPGVVVTVDDAPAPSPGAEDGGSDDLGQVLDVDLQEVVNGLWEAGAQAVSINGHRITSLSAIRGAGSAVLVDYRPLARPYVVMSIGPTSMERAFKSGQAGEDLADLHSGYGIRFDVEQHDRGDRAGGHVGHAALSEGGRMIAAIGLVIGIVLGVLLQPVVPLGLQPYLPIAVVAALDAVFGATRALLDGVFDDKVFVVSFVSNVVVAALIVFLGDQLGVGSQLSTGVIVVFSVRIFANVAAIRRRLFRA